MPVTVQERFESREATMGDSPSVDLQFWVGGTDNDTIAKGALLAAAPLWYADLIRQSATIKPVGPGLWDGTVRYGPRKRPETGELTFQFETGGGQHRITQSLETVQRKGPSPSQPAPDCKGAIGATLDGVEGVDITVPVFNFSETHYIAASAVTNAYKAALFNLTGTVNDAPFRGFAAGEVLFLGASGSKRGEEDWEITFKFAASPNATNLRVGDIAGIDKKGWEYLWVRYVDEVDEEAKMLVKRPIAAYVEKVYKTTDFAGLGIGT